MGHGIALQSALSGHRTVLVDTTDDNLERATANIGTTLGLLEQLDLAGPEAGSAPERIETTTDLRAAAAAADFWIEAVFEDLALKKRVFAELDDVAPAHVIFASNTSSFMTSQLAPATRRRDQVLVANWWNPPYLLPLVEVVRGPETSDATVDLTVGLFRRLGKRPVVLQRESPGFIGNRLQFALLREALAIVEAGVAAPEDVDAVVTSSFGRRLAVAGPLEVFDVAGWDTIAAIAEQLFPDLDNAENISETLGELVARGDHGVKSGQGFYPWTEASAARVRERIAVALAAIEQLQRTGDTTGAK